jgi:hypothetical protein
VAQTRLRPASAPGESEHAVKFNTGDRVKVRGSIPVQAGEVLRVDPSIHPSWSDTVLVALDGEGDESERVVEYYAAVLEHEQGLGT